MQSQQTAEGYRPFRGRQAGPDRGRPVVRVADSRDRDAVTDILVGGLGAKLLPAFGRSASAAVGAMLDTEFSSQSCNYFVAILNDHIAGVVHLDVGDPRDSSLLDDIRRAVGWPVTLRATAVLGALAPPVPTRREGMIEELAVHPSARRRGVASALLTRCEAEAVARGRDALILQVTNDNEGAIALYRRSGFRVRSQRRWMLRRWLFGSPGALIMEKSLL